MKKTIFVTQPYLPPQEEFVPYLEQIWDNKFLANGGSFHQCATYSARDLVGEGYEIILVNKGLSDDSLGFAIWLVDKDNHLTAVYIFQNFSGHTSSLFIVCLCVVTYFIMTANWNWPWL